MNMKADTMRNAVSDGAAYHTARTALGRGASGTVSCVPAGRRIGVVMRPWSGMNGANTLIGTVELRRVLLSMRKSLLLLAAVSAPAFAQHHHDARADSIVG